MGAPPRLETPAAAADLYHSQGPDTADFQHRPAFTGDVLHLLDGRMVCPVQHPCTMRRGLRLQPKILVCAVGPFADRIPDDWSTGHFRRTFLPQMVGQEAYAVEFSDMDLVTAVEVGAADRVVILSAYGVNLLLQRWTNHNNRVVIPTMTINVQTAGPFEEADLVSEALDALIAAGDKYATAEAKVDAWLGNRAGGGPSHRDRLSDAQSRSTVRRALRAQLDQWLNALDVAGSEASSAG